MAANKKAQLREQYKSLHRYFTGLVVAAFIVTVAGSAISGARAITITYRGAAVIVILGLIGRILIKSWASLEEMWRAESRGGRR